MALKCLVKSAKRVPFFRLPKKTHKSKLGWKFVTKESKNGTQMSRQKCQRVPFFPPPKKRVNPRQASLAVTEGTSVTGRLVWRESQGIVCNKGASRYTENDRIRTSRSPLTALDIGAARRERKSTSDDRRRDGSLLTFRGCEI